MGNDLELKITSVKVKAKCHKLGYYPYSVRKFACLLPKGLPKVLYKKFVRWERIVRWKLRKPVKFQPVKLIVGEPQFLCSSDIDVADLLKE